MTNQNQLQLFYEAQRRWRRRSRIATFKARVKGAYYGLVGGCLALLLIAAIGGLILFFS